MRRDGESSGYWSRKARRRFEVLAWAWVLLVGSVVLWVTLGAVAVARLP